MGLDITARRGRTGRMLRVVVLVVALPGAAVGLPEALRARPAETIGHGQAAAPASPEAKLAGPWVGLDLVGGGSWDGVNEAMPRAELTEAAKAAGGGRGRGGGRGAPPASSGPNPVGTPYVVSTGGCGMQSFPGMMMRSVGFTIIPARGETLMLAEQPGGRHIYTDGRPLPDPATLDASSTGYSIGRWEGSTFVVETVGVGGGVPGGGRAGPKTVLTERYSVEANGEKLAVDFTWNDPEIYVKPYNYKLYYGRPAKGSYAMEEWCDSSDPLQKQSIVPPAQIIK
jgi:hypothetical protein